MPLNGEFDLTIPRISMKENVHSRFCALEYRPKGLEQLSPDAAPLIVFVLQDEEGGLRFFVHQELPTIVGEEDSSLIESLLMHFLERSEFNSEAVFNQLSSLSVGPLVTRRVGSNIANHPDILLDLARFVNI